MQLYSIRHNVYSLLVSDFLLELPQALFLLHFIVVLFADLRYALTFFLCMSMVNGVMPSTFDRDSG